MTGVFLSPTTMSRSSRRLRWCPLRPPQTMRRAPPRLPLELIPTPLLLLPRILLARRLLVRRLLVRLSMRPLQQAS